MARHHVGALQIVGPQAAAKPVVRSGWPWRAPRASSLKVETVTNGPNTSSWHTRSASLARTTVGSTKQPGCKSAASGGLPPSRISPPSPLADLAELQHPLLVHLRGQRPHLGGRIQRIAQPDGRGQLQELLQELDRRSSRAAAAVSRRCRPGPGCGRSRTPNRSPRCVDIGVLENDVRALAAQFELHALQVAGRSLHDPAARSRSSR